MSNSGVRRTITELAVQSRREPDTKTVLVEGNEDKRVYSYLLEDCANLVFLPIQFVDVTLPVVSRQGAGGGNRARIIEAALQLEIERANTNSIKCIADTDLGFALNKGPEADGLLYYTDATCLELYFYNEKTLKRYLENFCGKYHIDAQLTLDTLKVPLWEMMSIRIALTEAGLPIEWIEVTLTKDKKNQIQFDQAGHLLKCLHKSNNAKQHQNVLSRCIYWNSHLSLMPCHESIHGHDFINSLRAYLRIQGFEKKDIDGDIFFKSLSICGKINDFSINTLIKSMQEFASKRSDETIKIREIDQA